MFNTHSIVRSLLLLNTKNAYFFKIFVDGFCLPEFEFLKHIRELGGFFPFDFYH